MKKFIATATAALLLAGGLVAGIALPASAAVPPPEVVPNSITTWHEQACGTATIYLRNISPWIYPVSHRVDSDAVMNANGPYGPVVDNRTNGGLNGPQKDVTGKRTFTFPEDSGTHTIRYAVRAGSESNLWRGQPAGEERTITVESDCLPNPVTVNWNTEVGGPTCDADGTLPALPVGDGFIASWDREFDGPGEYVATAVAEEGFVIEGLSSITVEVEGKVPSQSTDPEGECYVEPMPVTVDWNTEVGAPTCDADGTLPGLPEGDGFLVSWDREFDGPGEYVATAVAEDGFVIEGPSSITVKVEGKVPSQSTDPEVACYVKPAPTPTPTPTPPIDALPATGSDDISPILPLGGGLLVMLGIAALAMARVKKASL